MAKAIKKQALGRGLSALLNETNSDITSVSDKNADKVGYLPQHQQNNAIQDIQPQPMLKAKIPTPQAAPSNPV